MVKKRRNYTVEFKLEAIKLVKAILLADCPVSFTNFIASNLYHNKPS
ncbi:transposase [Wolbachia pipientis]|nr:transposase [Wolbachia pipientis]UIP91407.1 transposase [Wolbachia pipientis]